MSTIVALSTPQGRGAIAVIRMSGPMSLSLTHRLTQQAREYEPRVATLAHVRSGSSGELLDQVIVTFFKAPNSLTGEDVVELACHGSPAVIRQILDMCLEFGARLAGPGEFTLRALANGKINLAEAEAIRDLIDAQTEAAARQAARQLNGELSAALEPLKESLLEVIVVLESALEFVEDDLPEANARHIEKNLEGMVESLNSLVASYSSGHLLQQGIKVAISGRPNVGKSSLFNKLVARDRAIVTEIPGTTRDTLNESVDIGGIPVVLTDTAGLRATQDNIETMGIARAQQAITDADLVLLVLDGSVPILGEDRDLISQTAGARRLLVVNKCDLPSLMNGNFDDSEIIRVSAKTGEGIDELRSSIIAQFNKQGFDSGGLLITNARHYDLLKRSKDEIESAIELMKEHRSEELILIPLHNGLRYLGQITGETTTEDILTQIFSTFCIGK